MYCQLNKRRALCWRGPHPFVEHIPRPAPPCAHGLLAQGQKLYPPVFDLRPQEARIRGRRVGTWYEEFELTCEVDVTHVRPDTVGLERSLVPPTQHTTKSRARPSYPPHLIPFRCRNFTRHPPMKNRKIPLSKIGRSACVSPSVFSFIVL